MRPQQATPPSWKIPQVCDPPAVTDMNSNPGSDGGVDWLKSLRPQQTTVPSIRTPQLWDPPALTEINVPEGGVAWPYVKNRTSWPWFGNSYWVAQVWLDKNDPSIQGKSE